MYFAWMNMFTAWLVPFGCLGVAFYAHREYHGYTVDNHPPLPLFSLAAVAWGCGFLVCWRRQEARHALQWGALSSSFDSSTSSSSNSNNGPHSELNDHCSSDARRPAFPLWKRWRAYALSGLVTGGMLLVALVVLATSLNFQGYVQDVDLWTERVVKRNRTEGLFEDAVAASVSAVS